MGTSMLRGLTVASLWLALWGCGRSGLLGAKDKGLEAFCSGDSPKAVINGVASRSKVTGGIEMRSCCEAASFTVSTSSFDYKVNAGWQVSVGDDFIPASIDLAHPGQEWQTWVRLTCSSGQVCSPAPDSYGSAGQGWLEVSRFQDGARDAGFRMSICLRVAETPESPHPILHSFQLFAPDITARLSELDSQ